MAQVKRHYQPGVKTPTVTTAKKVIVARQPLSSLFTKDNYLWMGIGAAVVILGMLLMMGGKNENPNVFDKSVVYSTTRITIAPILILIGLMIEVYAIFKNPKETTIVTETK